MSVECRLYVGLTLELKRNLNSADFSRLSGFVEKYPELDEYAYHDTDKEGKLLLIGDGMNGDFLRLIYVDKFIDGGSLGDSNEFIELLAPTAIMPARCYDKELIEKMADIYEEYTDTRPAISDFRYAIWSQWY